MANIGYGSLYLLRSNGASGGNAGEATLPLLTGTGSCGLRNEGILPLLVSSGQGTTQVNIGVATLHLITGEGNGSPGEIGEGAGILPLLVSSGQLYPIVPGVGQGRLFLLLSDGNALSGVIASGAMILPMITGSGDMSPNCFGSGEAILPLIYGNGHGEVVPVTFNRKAIVMNILNHGVSHYVNFDFNSLFYFNGFLLGTNEQGAFIIDGNDDLGQLIQAEIGSGVSDLAKSGAMSIAREAWLSYRAGPGGMTLDTTIDEKINLSTNHFDKTGHAIKECRGKLGRGIKGRFFSWKIKNAGGSDFSLQSLRILGNLIRRKTR